jgi:cell wall assembly regulator SMI1
MTPQFKLISHTARSKPAPVAKSWRRIERWLKDHLPAAMESLSSGLDEVPIARFENVIGQVLPADFRESLRIHDGQERDPAVGIIFGLRLLSLHEGSLKEWSRIKQQIEAAGTVPAEDDSFPQGAVERESLNLGWVPVAADWGGNFLAIDLAPDTRGTKGQVISFGRDEQCKCVLARSWGHFLRDVADELEQANFQIADQNGTMSFLIKYPVTAHFLNNAIPWSRAKLSMTRMTDDEQSLWTKYGKRQGWGSSD